MRLIAIPAPDPRLQDCLAAIRGWTLSAGAHMLDWFGERGLIGRVVAKAVRKELRVCEDRCKSILALTALSRLRRAERRARPRLRRGARNGFRVAVRQTSWMRMLQRGAFAGMRRGGVRARLARIGAIIANPEPILAKLLKRIGAVRQFGWLRVAHPPAAAIAEGPCFDAPCADTS